MLHGTKRKQPIARTRMTSVQRSLRYLSPVLLPEARVALQSFHAGAASTFRIFLDTACASA